MIKEINLVDNHITLLYNIGMSKITSFIDNVGRVIVGEVLESSSDQYIEVKEPAVVNVQMNQQTGQISVQLLPFIFREFVKPEVRSEGTVWKFNKNTIVTSDNIELDTNIVQQYNNIFVDPPVTDGEVVESEAAPSKPDVVKLFDE